ncbi:MAG: toprim domain-containing protein [Burkholderiaceae bacterium]
MAPGSDITEIKSLLQARILDLIAVLQIEGYRAGRSWMGKNPTRADNKAGSFLVYISGARTGGWIDMATGDKGDVLQLIQYVLRLAKIGDAIRWAKDWLNYRDVPAPERAKVAAELAAKRVAAEQQEAEDLDKKRNRAFSVWLKCEAELRGTPAARYLSARGIRYSVLPRPPRAVRFSPSQKYTETGEHFPAIVALITGNGGERLAIHRTFLAPDGSGKAPVQHARKVWPSGWAGGTIKLARGETGLSPAEAAKHGLWDKLILCEGIEDGLSLAMACPEYRIWAAISLYNLANVRLPDCCGEVIVAADNDWGKRGAEKQLQRAIEALGRQGRKVLVARSHVGKDANDALRGAA